MSDGVPVRNSIYVYAPNKGAPVFFTVAFAISFVFHTYQCYRYKTWKMVGLQPLCALLFAAGYAMREWGAFNYIYIDENQSQGVLLVFILSQVFIYISPPLLELSNYHVLGRILYYVPWLSPFHPGLVLSLFGGIMLVVETLNAVGVALNSNPSAMPSSQNLGAVLTKVALGMQLGVLVIFFLLAGSFQYRCHKNGVPNSRIKTPLLTEYASTVLILIRCIYRLIEHIGNTKLDIDNYQALLDLTPLLRYEWFFYVFEATMMLLNSVLWNVFNPSRYLPAEHNLYIGRDGGEIVDDDEPVDDRGWFLKFMHLFTFGILFGRKRKDYKSMRQNAGNEELLQYRQVSGNDKSRSDGSRLA